MKISKAEYAKHFAGYTISDCVVRKQGIYCFIVRNTAESENSGPTAEANVTKKLVTYFPDESGEKRFGESIFEGYQQLRVGASRHDENKSVVVSSSGDVFATGGGSSEDEEEIPTSLSGPRRGSIFRLREIDGFLYAAGSGHTVCRRIARNNWESVCFDLPAPTRADFDDVERAANVSFDDLDGFSAEDLYAIAGRGRVWHFDGKKWTSIPFPSTMYLHSVCCAGDGYVYIGAQSGSIFRGRKNQWDLVHRGEFSLPLHDMVCHNGSVWGTSDYGLWYVEGQKLNPAEMPSSEVAVCAGNLSVADGVMLMAGAHGAAVHDGTSWHVLINAIEP